MEACTSKHSARVKEKQEWIFQKKIFFLLFLVIESAFKSKHKSIRLSQQISQNYQLHLIRERKKTILQPKLKTFFLLQCDEKAKTKTENESNNRVI